MTIWRSRDAHWTVRTISLNGRELLRVEADHPVMPAGEVPGRRTGPCQLYPGWWLQAEVSHVSQVEQFVQLAELTEISN
jgi:hypothetical protein